MRDRTGSPRAECLSIGAAGITGAPAVACLYVVILDIASSVIVSVGLRVRVSTLAGRML